MLSYDCGVIPGGKSIFLDATITAIGLKTGETNTYDPRGWVVDLGAGVASNPVLDSSGIHVVIQMSTGDIKNFDVELPMKVCSPWAGGKGRSLTPTLSQGRGAAGGAYRSLSSGEGEGVHFETKNIQV